MTTTSSLSRWRAAGWAARLNVSVKWRTVAGMLALFGVLLALAALVEFATPALTGTDGYYHMKMGLLIRQQGLTPPFVWLPLSILNRAAFYDHHLLYHVYLSLFTFDGSSEALAFGAKLSSVILPALAFLAIGWLLRGQGVRWASVWTVGLFAVSEAFLYRMTMPRAQSASLLVLALGLHWMLTRRFKLLIPLGFVYVWLYNAFPLLIVLGVVVVVATFATERRIDWQALAFPAVGIGLGLLINPYFPQNLTFIFNHLAPKIGESATPVGNEWYPYETWTLIENSGFAFGAFLLGVLALGWRGARIDRPTLTAFLLSVGFGLMLFKSRRFVEYAPAFALIFAALSASPLIERWVADRPRQLRLAHAGLIAALVVPLTITMSQARATMARTGPADQYAAAATWLKDHTPPGSLVFQTDWDDFPRLFFYDTANLYTIGLDPTYLELYDADLYAEWVQITKGKVEQPSTAIRERFGGEYVFSDLSHGSFLKQAAEDPGLREIYRDQYSVIFAVLP